jgi:hypothetical protein
MSHGAASLDGHAMLGGRLQIEEKSDAILDSVLPFFDRHLELG